MTSSKTVPTICLEDEKKLFRLFLLEGLRYFCLKDAVGYATMLMNQTTTLIQVFQELQDSSTQLKDFEELSLFTVKEVRLTPFNESTQKVVFWVWLSTQGESQSQSIKCVYQHPANESEYWFHLIDRRLLQKCSDLLFWHDYVSFPVFLRNYPKRLIWSRS